MPFQPPKTLTFTFTNHNLNYKLKTKLSPKHKHKQKTIMYQPRFTSLTFLCLALTLVLHTHLPICNGLSVVDLNLLKNSEINLITKRVCNKSIVECLVEPEMDSESNKRVLEAMQQQQHRYISYETLKRDMVPCDRAGASYYSCNARQANPYSRGCEVITGCARGVQAIKT